MFNSSLSKAVNEIDSSAQCVDRREMIQVQLSPNTHGVCKINNTG